MIGRTPRRGDRDQFVVETRHGGLLGAYNFSTMVWNAQGAGGRTGDLLNPSASGRDCGFYPTVAEGSPAADHSCAVGNLRAVAAARRTRRGGAEGVSAAEQE